MRVRISGQFRELMFPHHARSLKGYGADSRARCAACSPAYLMLGGFGRSSPSPGTGLPSNPNHVDAHAFRFPWSLRFDESDVAFFRSMQKQCGEIGGHLKARRLTGGETSREDSPATRSAPFAWDATRKRRRSMATAVAR